MNDMKAGPLGQLTGILTAAEAADVLNGTAAALHTVDFYSNYSIKEFACENEAEHQARAEELRNVKGWLDTVEATRTGVTKPRNDAIGAINAHFKTIANNLATIMSALKTGILSYEREREREAAEQARKAREAAAKEEAKLLAQAEAARDKGNEVRAEALESRAMNVTAAPPPPPPKAAGVAGRDVWRWEVTNASLVPAEYKVIDEKRIGAMVRTMKQDANIPGVRVWKERDLSVRGL